MNTRTAKLYDSETREPLTARDLNMTRAEYIDAIRRSALSKPEGHVCVNGRRVYAE